MKKYIIIIGIVLLVIVAIILGVAFSKRGNNSDNKNNVDKNNNSELHTRIINDSMSPTIKDGQIVTYTGVEEESLKRGDIIIAYQPSSLITQKSSEDENSVIGVYEDDNKNSKLTCVKRIIGIPGDHIEIKDGLIYVNDTLLEEPYIDKNVKTTSAGGVYVNVTVPNKCVYVLGDNRDNSLDSRRYGCIPFDKIIGIVKVTD